MTKLVNAEHYHDLGKFMLAFTIFWAYIAFSQFMLIWYANIPRGNLVVPPSHHRCMVGVGRTC